MFLKRKEKLTVVQEENRQELSKRVKNSISLKEHVLFILTKLEIPILLFNVLQNKFPKVSIAFPLLYLCYQKLNPCSWHKIKTTRKSFKVEGKLNLWTGEWVADFHLKNDCPAK